jgi:hypothetical protein
MIKTNAYGPVWRKRRFLGIVPPMHGDDDWGRPTLEFIKERMFRGTRKVMVEVPSMIYGEEEMDPNLGAVFRCHSSEKLQLLVTLGYLEKRMVYEHVELELDDPNVDLFLTVNYPLSYDFVVLAFLPLWAV